MVCLRMFMVWVGLFDMNVLIMKVLFCIAPNRFRKVEILARKRESERHARNVWVCFALGNLQLWLDFSGLVCVWNVLFQLEFSVLVGIFCFSWKFSVFVWMFWYGLVGGEGKSFLTGTQLGIFLEGPDRGGSSGKITLMGHF